MLCPKPPTANRCRQKRARHEESLFAQRALAVGASGYIHKQEATTHVIEAIRRVLSIQDDGIAVQSTETRGCGLGIHIMGYRAGIIGGQLTIETPDQGGTLVECRCPSTRRAGIEAASAGPGR